MKYLGYILFLLSVLYYKFGGGAQSEYAEPKDSVNFLQSKANLDSLYSKSDSLAMALTESDQKVVGKISNVSNKIVSLKKEVATLTEKVVQLTNENNELKQTINNISNKFGSKYKLLPIAEDNRQ